MTDVRVLVTGGAGFIGHAVVADLLSAGGYQVTLLDRLDHAGNLNRLSEIGLPNTHVRFLFHDLRAAINSHLAQQLGTFDWILHLAAATHVDRSIADPMAFVQDNVVATCNLLEFARRVGCGGFLYFSTDEVFGPAPPGHSYKEDDRYRCGNPYAATKAGAEELCVAYHNTYGLPIFVTHTMNVVGRRQNPEKFVPMTIANVRDGNVVSIHADRARERPGSRFYIDADDVAQAVRFLLKHGRPGEKYNVVGADELDNLTVAQRIADAMGSELRYELTNFHASRPGHDLRYALDGAKMRDMGWHAKPVNIGNIVDWYMQNPRWLPDARQSGDA